MHTRKLRRRGLERGRPSPFHSCLQRGKPSPREGGDTLSISPSARSCGITAWVSPGQPGTLTWLLPRMIPPGSATPSLLSGFLTQSTCLGCGAGLEKRARGGWEGRSGSSRGGGGWRGPGDGGQGPGSRGAARAALTPRPTPAPLPREVLHLPGPAEHSRGLSSGAVLPLGWGSGRHPERPLAAPTVPRSAPASGRAPRPA